MNKNIEKEVYAWSKLQQKKIMEHRKIAKSYPFYFNIDQSLVHFTPVVFYPGDRLFALAARRQFVEVTENDVRWLTPAECAWFMNLDITPFEKATKSQQYKAIGNSIDVGMFDKLPNIYEKGDKIAELFGGVCAYSQWLGETPFEYAEIAKIGDVISEYYGIDNLKDVTEITELKSNMIVAGSPCTSFSLAGRREGGEKGTGTASSLLWEIPRIIKHNPQINKLIFENVAAITNRNNKPVLDAFKEELTDLGFAYTEHVIEADKTKRKRYFIVAQRKIIKEI